MRSSEKPALPPLSIVIIGWGIPNEVACQSF